MSPTTLPRPGSPGNGSPQARIRKLQSLLPRKFSGVDASHGQRLRRHLRDAAKLHQQREQHEPESERHQAHHEEADRLEVDLAGRGVERPVAVEHEVVEHRHQPRQHRRELVGGVQRVHEQRIYGEVDDVPRAPDEPEADQLQPVGGSAHAVQQAHMGAQLAAHGHVSGAHVHGGVLREHAPGYLRWRRTDPARASRARGPPRARGGARRGSARGVPRPRARYPFRGATGMPVGCAALACREVSIGPNSTIEGRAPRGLALSRHALAGALAAAAVVGVAASHAPYRRRPFRGCARHEGERGRWIAGLAGRRPRHRADGRGRRTCGPDERAEPRRQGRDERRGGDERGDGQSSNTFSTSPSTEKTHRCFARRRARRPRGRSPALGDVFAARRPRMSAARARLRGGVDGARRGRRCACRARLRGAHNRGMPSADQEHCGDAHDRRRRQRARKRVS